MKKIIFVVFLSTLIIPCLSQNIITKNGHKEWAPIGAKWYFTKPTLSESNNVCILFESVKDTVINERTCRKIEIKSCANPEYILSKEYIYQNNDSIFYFNSGNFYLLYDFSAKLEDTIMVHKNWFKPTDGYLFDNEDSIQYFKYKIIDIDSIEISGEWLKRQTVSPLKDGDWGFGINGVENFIIEKLGSLVYFFGRYGIIYTSSVYGILRCYSDSSFSFFNPDWNNSCDYISGLNKIELNDYLKIFPNPVKEIIKIETKNLGNGQVNIYNLVGIKELTVELNSKITELNIRHLLPGIYIVECIFYNPTMGKTIIQKTKVIKR